MKGKNLWIIMSKEEFENGLFVRGVKALQPAVKAMTFAPYKSREFLNMIEAHSPAAVVTTLNESGTYHIKINDCNASIDIHANFEADISEKAAWYEVNAFYKPLMLAKELLALVQNAQSQVQTENKKPIPFPPEITALHGEIAVLVDKIIFSGDRSEE